MYEYSFVSVSKTESVYGCTFLHVIVFKQISRILSLNVFSVKIFTLYIIMYACIYFSIYFRAVLRIIVLFYLLFL